MIPGLPDHPRTDLHRPGFTLIELLVVILIIVILISLLLTALKEARESGWTTKCMVNVKQIGIGAHTYSNDFKGRVWESGSHTPYRFWYAQPQNPLLPLSAANPAVVGPAFSYLGDVDKIFECPKNKRRTPVRDVANFTDSFWGTPAGQLQRQLWNFFYADRALTFDYTMLTGASGAKVESEALVAWDSRSDQFFPQAQRSPPPTPALRYFRALPLFVEEDLEWYNMRSPDGMWSNWDRMTNRHAGRGLMVFLNGDVELMRLPRGGDPLVENARGNFTGNDVWAKGRQNRWYQVAPSWPANPRPFGWFDMPR